MQRDHFSFLLEDSDKEFFSKVAQDGPALRAQTGFSKFAAQVERDVTRITSQPGISALAAGESYMDKIASMNPPQHVYDEVFYKVAYAAVEHDIGEAYGQLIGMVGREHSDEISEYLTKTANEVLFDLGFEKDALMGAVVRGASKLKGVFGKGLSRAGTGATAASTAVSRGGTMARSAVSGTVQGTKNLLGAAKTKIKDAVGGFRKWRLKGMDAKTKRLKGDLDMHMKAPAGAPGSAREAFNQRAISSTSNKLERSRLKGNAYDLTHDVSLPKAPKPPKPDIAEGRAAAAERGRAKATESRMNNQQDTNRETASTNRKRKRDQQDQQNEGGQPDQQGGGGGGGGQGASNDKQGGGKRKKDSSQDSQDGGNQQGQRADNQGSQGGGKAPDGPDQAGSAPTAAATGEKAKFSDAFSKVTDQGWGALSGPEKGALIRAGLYTAAGYRVVTGRGAVTGGEGIV